jgi:co-chaperonin GroES (HSP10)
MKAIKKNVLVELDPRVEISKGGIYLAEKSQRPEEWGTVVSVGGECELLSVGERVYIPSTQGTRFEIDGKDMILILEKRILAVET